MQIRVKVITGTNKEKVLEKKDGRFEVHVRAKAEKGKANEEIKVLLSHYFNVSVSSIYLIKGKTTPNKIFFAKI